MMPMFLVVLIGVSAYVGGVTTALTTGRVHIVPALMFPLSWVAVVCVIGLISAVHQRRYRLIPLAPAAVLYVFLAYAIWLVHGVAGLLTGREPQRDKPTRYAHVVG
jgi:hypothetical protein